MTSETEIRPFRVDLPEAEIAELRRRIVATRWPDQETVTDDSQGVRLALMQGLVRYWGTDYDWRTCEGNLNALPQFMTGIDGLDIHFIHVRSRHEDALPSTPSPSRSRSPSASSPTSSTRPRRAGPRAYPHNLIHYNTLDRGGHFAAWEQPDLFSAEMRASFKTLR